MSNRFHAGTDNLGYWVVRDAVTGDVRNFGSGHWGRIDALDFADHQNLAARRAAEVAAPVA